MNTWQLKAQLEKLYALILRERECAKSFDLEGLTAVNLEKEELLGQLELEPGGDPELEGLAGKIKHENRRNAYLFWSTLRFIRENMSFFNRQVSQPSYGAGGHLVHHGGNGLVLTGRV